MMIPRASKDEGRPATGAMRTHVEALAVLGTSQGVASSRLQRRRYSKLKLFPELVNQLVHVVMDMGLIEQTMCETGGAPKTVYRLC